MPPQLPFADPDSTQVMERPIDLAETERNGTIPKGHRRRRRYRALVIVLAVVALLAGSGMIASWLYIRSVNGDVKRVNAFNDVPEASRPKASATAKGATNYLVLGSDSRDPDNDGGSRTDTIILLHVNKDRSKAQLTSINRDTWTHIPRSQNGQHGNTDAKINAAFAWGGVPLMVQTIEAYTNVRIDHVVLVDFGGFKEIVDALGGVDIDVEQDFTSTHSLNPGGVRKFHKGPQTMDGATALDYARERFAFKEGDFARVRHQQQVIKAIMNKAASGGMLANPARLNSFLRATATAVSVDQSLNTIDTAMSLRHLRSESLAFYTSPTKGTGKIGTQSVVLPDRARAKQYFDAIRDDDMETIAKVGQK